MQKLWLFMPTINQKPKKLLSKIKDIQNTQLLLEREKIGFKVLAGCDGNRPEFKTPETLDRMKKELGPIFDFFCNERNLGKTATVVEGLNRMLVEAGPRDKMGCLDDNEHDFISSLDLLDRIKKGYLGAIGTISYPQDILNNIDRHAMPAVGAIESQIMNIKGTLCIYASGYWIQHAEIVRVALKVYPHYRKKFREMFPNEIIEIPGWGTPTLFQDFMTWVIRTQSPWNEKPKKYRRLITCYLPCKEVPSKTPLGRSLPKALNQLRALILNGLVLDELLGRERNKPLQIN